MLFNIHKGSSKPVWTTSGSLTNNAVEVNRLAGYTIVSRMWMSIDYEVSADPTFSTTLLTSYAQTSETLSIPNEVFAVNTIYYVRARYHYADGTDSGWVDGFTFTSDDSYPVLFSADNDGGTFVGTRTVSSLAYAANTKWANAPLKDISAGKYFISLNFSPTNHYGSPMVGLTANYNAAPDGNSQLFGLMPNGEADVKIVTYGSGAFHNYPMNGDNHLAGGYLHIALDRPNGKGWMRLTFSLNSPNIGWLGGGDPTNSSSAPTFTFSQNSLSPALQAITWSASGPVAHQCSIVQSYETEQNIPAGYEYWPGNDA